MAVADCRFVTACRGRIDGCGTCLAWFRERLDNRRVVMIRVRRRHRARMGGVDKTFGRFGADRLSMACRRPCATCRGPMGATVIKPITGINANTVSSQRFTLAAGDPTPPSAGRTAGVGQPVTGLVGQSDDGFARPVHERRLQAARVRRTHPSADEHQASDMHVMASGG